MSLKPIKEGWIEKRSQFLQQWRKRWLFLTNESLSTYKFPSDLTPTLSLSITSITDAIPCEVEVNKEFSFKLCTKRESVYITAEDDQDMCNWLNSINSFRRENILSLHSYTNQLLEHKVHCELLITNTFTLIKEILFARETQLLREYDQLYAKKKEFASEFQEKNSNELTENTENYSKLLNKLESVSEKASAMRELQKQTPLVPLLSLCLTDTVFSLNPSQLRCLIRSQFSIESLNPNERVIRRTKITRALKWCYTSDRLDALTFTVSQNVYLSGIGLCGPYKPGQRTKIQAFSIRHGPITDSKVVYKHPHPETMEFNPNSSVHKLSFNIFLRQNTKYTVVFSIIGSPTFKCVDCQPEIQGDTEVKWKFYDATFALDDASNRCDKICGPIADFFYINPS